MNSMWLRILAKLRQIMSSTREEKEKTPMKSVNSQTAKLIVFMHFLHNVSQILDTCTLRGYSFKKTPCLIICMPLQLDK